MARGRHHRSIINNNMTENELLQKLDRVLFGNGQKGAIERITRIEENVEAISESNKIQIESNRLQALANKEQAEVNRTQAESNKAQAEINKVQFTSIDKLVSGIDALKSAVETHHKDSSLHSFMGISFRKQIIVWVMISFVVFHAIISAIPDLNIVLQFLLRIVGVPLP